MVDLCREQTSHFFLEDEPELSKHAVRARCPLWQLQNMEELEGIIRLVHGSFHVILVLGKNKSF